MFRAAVQHFGRVHAVASNAGYSLLGAAEELQLDAIRHIVDTQSHRVNRTGAGNCGADALGGGHLVQVSSGAGQAAFPGLSLYCATKWGIEGFFDSLYRAGGRRLRNSDDTRRTGYYPDRLWDLRCAQS